MSTNEFDKLIVDKFDQHEFAFKPAQWEKLSKELGKPKETKKIIPLTGGWMKTAAMAAGLVAVVSVFGWLYTANQPEENGIAVNKTEQVTPAITPQQTIASQQKEQLQQPAGQIPSIDLDAYNKQLNEQIKYSRQPNHPYTPSIIVKDGHTTATTTVADNNNIQPSSPAEQKVETPQTAVSFQPNKGYAPANKDIDLSRYASDEPMPQQRQRQSNASIGLTGGMNYGSLNAGYVAGVTARKKVTGNVFVEGDLAFVSNKADQATMSEVAFQVAAAGDVNSLGAVSPSSVKSANMEAASSNFNYVQFTPSVGYQVMPKLSVSVGADFQRLLGYDDDMKNVVYENNQTKLAPTMDVGITGKTEVAVTRKLKAGLLYREGVNNMVRGSTSKQYLERRYLQVQLKFTVFDRN